MVVNKQIKWEISKNYDINTEHDLSMKLYYNQTIIRDVVNYLVDNTTTDISTLS